MSKLDSKLKKINYDIFVYPYLALLSFLCCMQSAFSPWSVGGVRVDDCVFYYIGQAMTKGQMPYRDIFDHKGPLLHIINWIGAAIAGKQGIWLISLVLIFLCFLFSYKACHLFTSRFSSIIATTTVAIFLIQTYRPGNRVEEYSMPFIFIAIYMFACYFKNNYTFKNWQLIVVGFTFTCVCMLRPNMTGVWIAFCAVIFIRDLIKKRFKDVARYALFFIVGALIFIVPLLIWFIATDTFNDFVYQYFTFNFAYTGSTKGIDNLILVFKYFLTFLKSGYALYIMAAFYVGAFMIYIYKKRKGIEYDKQKYAFVATFFLFTVISYLAMLMSLRAYAHYFMSFYPCVIIPFAMTYDCFIDQMKKRDFIQSKLLAQLLVACMVIFSFYSLLSTYEAVVKIVRTEDQQVTKVADIIIDNTDPDDEITVYSNCSKYYLWSGRDSFSKYLYQTPIAVIDKNIGREYIEDLETRPPKVVVIADEKAYMQAQKTAVAKYLNKMLSEDYTLINRVKGSRVYRINSSL